MYKPERGAIVWRKHVMTYMKPDTGYMKEALASDRRVKYCRIVRRTLKGVRRWFVQLVVEGLPPVRKVYASKCEVVGIDPGSSRIAYFHERHAAIVEVAPHVDLKEPKIRLLQRRIDRSRRANNPDGTVKKGSSTWNTSNRGRRTAARSKLRKTITDLFNAASDGRQNGGEWVSLWSISNARLKAVPEDQRGQDEGSPNQLPRRQIPWFWECQDFCVWGGYSRGSPTRLPFVFEMQYARPDAIAGAKVEGPARSAGGSSLAPAIARREAAGALAREV